MAPIAGPACVHVTHHGPGPDLDATLRFDCEGDLQGWEVPYRSIRVEGELRVRGCRVL